MEAGADDQELGGQVFEQQAVQVAFVAKIPVGQEGPGRRGLVVGPVRVVGWVASVYPGTHDTVVPCRYDEQITP